MSIVAEALWNLSVEAKLLTAQQCDKLRADFAGETGGNGATAEQVSQWLVGKGAISRYQANILLAGQPGPFVYGDYQIYERIETGRLAGIFRALHVPSRHRVCLMFLSGEALQDSATVARLAQQAAIVNRLSQGHPHLLRCYHLCDLGTFKFLVVEDLLGRRVERLLSKKGALKPHEACRIARQVALALARLHGMQQVHGDVRPANFWMDTAGPIKLLQFPLSRDPLEPPFSLSTARPGKDGRAPLEFDYLAPELASGQPPDARSDIYALGCSLYQMLANQVPFPGGDIAAKLARIASETPQPIQELNPAVSPELAKLIGYMMHKNPDLRFQQVTSVVERLLAHLSPEDAQSQPPVPKKAAARYDAWLMEYYKTAGFTLPPAKPSAGSQPDSGKAVPGAAVAGAAAAVAATPAAPQPAPVQPAMTAQPVPTVPQPGAPAQPVVAAAPAMMAQPVVAQPAVAPVGMAQPMMAPAVAAQPAAAPMYAPVGAPQGYAAPAPGFAAPAAPSAFVAPAAPGAAAPSAASTVAAQVRARQRRQKVQTMLMALAMVLVVGVGVTWYLLNGSSPTPTVSTAVTPETPQPAAPSDQPAMADQAARPEEPPPETTPPPAAAVSQAKFDEALHNLDSPKWRSPTAGQPIDVRFLPPGVNAVIALRPADILEHPFADRLLDAQHMGELAGWIPNTLPQLSGTRAENIEQAVIGLLASPSGSPRMGLVVRTLEAVDRDELLAQWGNPSAQSMGGQEVFVVGDRAYYLPAAGNGRLIVMAPAAEMPDVVTMNGEVPPPLAQPIEFMLATSDDRRMATLVLAPKFLETGGQAMLYGPGERLRGPLNWLLTGFDPAAGSSSGANVLPQDLEPPRAILASLHLDDNLFAELRVFDMNTSPQQTSLAEALRRRVAAIPRGVDRYNRRLLITPYSEELLYRFPEYLQQLDRNVRAAVADKQAVLRLVLPSEATELIWLGGYLSLVEHPLDRSSFAAATPTTTAPPAATASAADKLKKTMDLSFDRNTLEKSMEMIADEIGAPIVILGSDLQLEGITKNQSFGIDERGKPASEIMQIIFQRANPDGKLVYVIKPDESGEETVFVTTRAAVANRGDKLPPEFELPKR